jgi:predicted nucleic acid-binding protein
MSRGRFPDNQVFVDTSAFFAISNRRDSSHENAIAILRRLIQVRTKLVTTNFIVAELHALLLARGNRVVALAALELYDDQAITIVRVSEADESEARAIIERYDDKTFSFTDATCFAIMRRLTIQRAFTLDRNFRQYGLEVIPSHRSL